MKTKPINVREHYDSWFFPFVVEETNYSVIALEESMEIATG